MKEGDYVEVLDNVPKDFAEFVGQHGRVVRSMPSFWVVRLKGHDTNMLFRSDELRFKHPLELLADQGE